MRRLITAHQINDAVGILLDQNVKDLFLDGGSSAFVQRFCAEEAKIDIHRHFSHSITQWVKNIIFLHNSFQDGKLRKCLMLPLKNFSAAEIPNLMSIINNEATAADFQMKIEQCVKSIRQRSVPKKRKSGNRHFLKDNQGRHFELGKEHHGQAETTCPPHSLDCCLSASSRFGITLNREEHFNVSMDGGNISGYFTTCHTEQTVTKCTHINMFPNSHIR